MNRSKVLLEKVKNLKKGNRGCIKLYTQYTSALGKKYTCSVFYEVTHSQKKRQYLLLLKYDNSTIDYVHIVQEVNSSPN